MGMGFIDIIMEIFLRESGSLVKSRAQADLREKMGICKLVTGLMTNLVFEDFGDLLFKLGYLNLDYFDGLVYDFIPFNYPHNQLQPFHLIT